MPSSDQTPIASNHWQLFLDDNVVARSTGFDRVVHHPRAHGVVIAADRPWETAGVAPMLVDRADDGSFVAYYRAMWWDIDQAGTLPEGFRQDRAHHIFHSNAYATSEDGIHWHKPNLGLADAPAATDWARHAPYPSPNGVGRDNNLGVPFVPVADLGRHGNVADPARRFALRLAPDPSKPVGVGAMWSYAPRGYFAAAIPDFLGDPAWREKLTDAGSSFNPRRHQVHFWDDLHEEWVAMDQGVVPSWLPTREIARFASKDLINWTSTSALYPDAADSHLLGRYDEPMAMAPFWAEGVAFGMIMWFHSDRSHPDAGPVLTPTPEHPHIWPWCRKGTCELRIAISRDGGLTWDRTVSREAWIPHGAEEDSYDRLVIGPLPPVRVDDEDWFYVEVIDGDHLITRNNVEQDPYYHDRVPRHQIALYTQKHNRYASLTAKAQPEVLLTKPVEVTGGTLHLNVDASRGEVRVGIASAEPVPTFEGTVPSVAPHLREKNMLPGFSFDDCEPVLANSIEHEVRFRGGAGIESLRGKPVCLLFRMADADLYGFRMV